MYGNDFSFLGLQQPEKAMLAQGSKVTVDWKRIQF
jgi:hypothetical protein